MGLRNKLIISTVALVGIGTCAYNNMATKEVCEIYRGHYVANNDLVSYIFDPKPLGQRKESPKIRVKGEPGLPMIIGERYCFTVKNRDILGYGTIDGKSIRRK